MATPTPHASESRKGRLTEKLVAEVVKRVMFRSPDVGLSVSEQQAIEERVREAMFRGKPLTARDIDRLVDSIISARPPPAKSVPVVDDEAGSQTSLPQPSAASATTKSLRADSQRRSSRASSVGSAASHASLASRRSIAQLSSGHSSASGRLDLIRDRDRAALEELAKICSMESYYVPPSKHESLQRRAAKDPWLAQAMRERDAAEAAAREAREKRLKEQARLRDALAHQIDAKDSVKKLEVAESLAEHEARVRDAQSSLEAEEAKKAEVRRKKENERREMAAEQERLRQRKVDVVKEEQSVDRARVESERQDHEALLKTEQEARRQSILALRHLLLTESEKKKKEKQQRRLEALEREHAILRDMTERIEVERRKQETARQQRVAAAREAIEFSREMANDRDHQLTAETRKQDMSTIDGDRFYNEREKEQAAKRRVRNQKTQEELKRQIRERALNAAVEKEADAQYVQAAELDEAEARIHDVEEKQVKREAQRQWRMFLQMQQRAKANRSTIDDVPVSIARPVSDSPWV